MLFSKKNKIKQTIDDINDETISDEIDSEFELLTKVKRKNNEKRLLNRVFVQPVNNLKTNSVAYSNKLTSYFKQHYVGLTISAIAILTVICLALALAIIFLPHPITVNGDYQIALNNFYLGINGNLTGLTPIGIAFIVLFIFDLIIAILYLVKFKLHQMISKSSTASACVSFINWGFLFVSIIFILALILIPPKTVVSNNQQELYNLAYNIQYLISQSQSANPTPELNNQIQTLINQLSQLTQNGSYNVTPLIDTTISGFQTWMQNSGIYYNIQNITNGLIYSTGIGSSEYILSTSGIITTTLLSFILSLTIIFLPFTLFLLISFAQVKTKEEVVNSWSNIRLWFFNLMNSIKTFFNNIFHRNKDKDSYYKYKKRLKDKGLLVKENKSEFTTDATKQTAVKQQISREEIEINPANIAFLSKEGKWMYHDGKGHFFIARNNQWEPYDIDQELHKAHANIVDESLNFSPSEKVAKESRFNFKNKKESSIALPDKEIDDIVKDLNI